MIYISTTETKEVRLVEDHKEFHKYVIDKLIENLKEETN
jgi:hypothetical protein